MICAGGPASPQVPGTEVSGGATAQVFGGGSSYVKAGDAGEVEDRWETFWMRERSAIYRLPALSKAEPVGSSSDALTAGR